MIPDDIERERRNRNLQSLKKTRRSTQPRRVEEVDRMSRRKMNYRRSSASRRSVFRRSTPNRAMRRNSRAFLP